MDISVIMPVYDSEKTIRQCILSLLDSDFDKKFEIIVVDDGSKDGSVDQIRDLNVRVIHQENAGAAAAKNKGVENAKSNLVLFVDSDVVFFRNTLKKIYEHLSKDEVDYVSVRYSMFPVNNKWIHKYKALADYCYYYYFIYSKRQRKRPIKNADLGGGTEGYKKEVFQKFGGFDSNIKGADVEREKLVSHLLNSGYNVIGDGNIFTKHNFPDFTSLVKNYYYRTIHTLDLVDKHGYSQPYLGKNLMRILSVPLFFLSLILSIYLFFRFDVVFPFFISFILLVFYFVLHSKLYELALKHYGLFFTGYTFVVNLFFNNLIAFGGVVGVIKSLLSK